MQCGRVGGRLLFYLSPPCVTDGDAGRIVCMPGSLMPMTNIRLDSFHYKVIALCAFCSNKRLRFVSCFRHLTRRKDECVWFSAENPLKIWIFGCPMLTLHHVCTQEAQQVRLIQYPGGSKDQEPEAEGYQVHRLQ